MFKGSWRTTASGVAAGLALLLEQAQALLDSDPATVLDINVVVAAIGLIVMALNTRDDKVSSENAGAK